MIILIFLKATTDKTEPIQVTYGVLMIDYMFIYSTQFELRHPDNNPLWDISSKTHLAENIYKFVSRIASPSYDELIIIEFQALGVKSQMACYKPIITNQCKDPSLIEGL